jgi:hypothetical protein
MKRGVLLVVAALGAATIGCTKHRGTGMQGGTAGSTVVGAAGASGGGAGGAAGAGGAGASGSAGTTGSASTTGSAGTTGSGGSIGGTGGGGAGGTIAFYPLDMNDVTILAPLPASSTTPVLLSGSDLADDGTALVPRVLFDRLAAPDGTSVSPILNAATYDRLQLVAVRFDLCDRHQPGPCPLAEDARMRLVFQPLGANGQADDAGFHAFYAIRNDEIAAAVTALRELAMIAPPQTGALRVSPALSAADPAPYAAKVRAFVKRYGGDARIVRLTLNAQPQVFAQVRWSLSGVEKRGDVFADITIVDSTAISEAVILEGSPGYNVTPVADTPSGLRGAIVMTMFDAADATTKRAYLATLAAVENPLTHTAETVPCVACHVSTVVTAARSASAGIDPLTIPGRYTSTFDLSIAGGKSAETRVTRAFGYIGKQPMISQRVVNDTAQTLTEIEARYPGP